MEQFQKDLQEALKNLRIADHMTYVTYPLVKEQRLLLKIFDEIYKSVINSINTVLNYESVHKRIKLNSGSEENLKTFFKIAKDYSLSNTHIKKILEIINLNKKHKESSMEFVKKDKVVIMSDNLNVQALDLRAIKEYLLLAKEFILSVNKKISSFR